MVQDAEEQKDYWNKNALQSADIWQNVKHCVSSSFDQGLIQAHLYLDSLD